MPRPADSLLTYHYRLNLWNLSFTELLTYQVNMAGVAGHQSTFWMMANTVNRRDLQLSCARDTPSLAEQLKAGRVSQPTADLMTALPELCHTCLMSWKPFELAGCVEQEHWTAGLFRA
jgi:hypothetical protein